MNKELLYLGLTIWTGIVCIYDIIVLCHNELEIHTRKNIFCEILLDHVGFDNFIVAKLLSSCVGIILIWKIKKAKRRGKQYYTTINNMILYMLIVQTVFFIYLFFDHMN